MKVYIVRMFGFEGVVSVYVRTNEPKRPIWCVRLPFVYTYLNVCCNAGMKTPLAVDPPETKKSASLSESFFARAPSVSLVVGWMRAADERRFCQLAPRDALLRICLQMRTKGMRLTNHFSFSCLCYANR